MCELQRTLDNEWKLQEFLGVKGQYRDTGDLNNRKDVKKQNRNDEIQKKVTDYNQILELIKQFTGDFFIHMYNFMFEIFLYKTRFRFFFFFVNVASIIILDRSKLYDREID